MPRTHAFRFILLLLGAACLHVPSAMAEVRRCTSPDGGTIYTDRRCVDLGATDRIVHAADQPARFYRRGCSRTLLDLIYELTAAIDSGDVNRVAGVFDWAGASTRNGYALMDRLDVLAKRPLVDVVRVYPHAAGEDPDALYPTTPVHQAPVALRLEQTLADGSTPSHTVLGLHRYLGCWWVRL